MEITVLPTVHGGRRPGSGRKTKEVDEAVKAAIEADGKYVDYAKARAKKETFAAHAAELDFQIKSREFVPRDAVRRATSAAFAACAQTLRSIPDNVERRLGLAPEVAEEVGRLIDESMADLAADLERMHDGF